MQLTILKILIFTLGILFTILLGTILFCVTRVIQRKKNITPPEESQENDKKVEKNENKEKNLKNEKSKKRKYALSSRNLTKKDLKKMIPNENLNTSNHLFTLTTTRESKITKNDVRLDTENLKLDDTIEDCKIKKIGKLEDMSVDCIENMSFDVYDSRFNDSNLKRETMTDRIKMEYKREETEEEKSDGNQVP